jgi:hypothetical protein
MKSAAKTPYSLSKSELLTTKPARYARAGSGKARTRRQRAELCFLQDTQLSERCDTIVQPVLLDDLTVHDLEDRYAGESHFSPNLKARTGVFAMNGNDTVGV